MENMLFVFIRVCLDENLDMNKYIGVKFLIWIVVVKKVVEIEMKFDFIVCVYKVI